MKTSYTKDQLETLLMKLESRPNDGVKDRIKAIQDALETMEGLKGIVSASFNPSGEMFGDVIEPIYGDMHFIFNTRVEAEGNAESPPEEETV